MLRLGRVNLELLRLDKIELEASHDGLGNVVSRLGQGTDPKALPVHEDQVRVGSSNVEDDRRLLGVDVVLDEVQKPEVANREHFDRQAFLVEIEEVVLDGLPAHGKEADLPLFSWQVLPVDQVIVPDHLIQGKWNLLRGLVTNHFPDLLLVKSRHLDEAREGALARMGNHDRVPHLVPGTKDIQRFPGLGSRVDPIGTEGIVHLINREDLDVVPIAAELDRLQGGLA